MENKHDTRAGSCGARDRGCPCKGGVYTRYFVCSFYLIESIFIWFNLIFFILFCFILHLIKSYFILLFYFVYFILFYLIFFYFILFYFILVYFILFLFYFILFLVHSSFIKIIVQWTHRYTDR